MSYQTESGLRALPARKSNLRGDLVRERDRLLYRVYLEQDGDAKAAAAIFRVTYRFVNRRIAKLPAHVKAGVRREMAVSEEVRKAIVGRLVARGH